jgi:hypothetical protein
MEYTEPLSNRNKQLKSQNLFSVRKTTRDNPLREVQVPRRDPDTSAKALGSGLKPETKLFFCLRLRD